MSTRNDYSVGEWQVIAAAPAAAGLAITLSDHRPLGGAESCAAVVGSAIARSAVGDAPEVVRVLAACVKSRNNQADVPAMPAGDRRQAREALIAIVEMAVRAVETKSTDEVEPFKTWIASIAAKVFHVAPVASVHSKDDMLTNSDEQEAAITRLAAVLRPRRGLQLLRTSDRQPAGLERSNRRLVHHGPPTFTTTSSGVLASAGRSLPGPQAT